MKARIEGHEMAVAQARQLKTHIIAWQNATEFERKLARLYRGSGIYEDGSSLLTKFW